MIGQENKPPRRGHATDHHNLTPAKIVQKIYQNIAMYQYINI